MNTSTSSPALHSRQREWTPSTPPPSHPPLPHSTSSPSLPTSSSLPHLSSPNTPKSTQKNYHPYLIQSTSSSLLTRSNSSPSQPLHTLSKHRPSRSMSSLAQNAVSENEMDSGEAGMNMGGREGDRRKSLESPLTRRPIVRSSKSGTLPTFLEEKEAASPRKKVELPVDPKSWTPSELALYLDQALRTGGEDGTGKKLPGPLVEDIKTWVLRQQVNGRAFLRGNSDTWGNSSRPPPFLPLLLSISRRLRRTSIQADQFDPVDPACTILHETDEDDEVSGVKRMANAFELRDSASDASEAEEDIRGGARALRAQLTGGNEGWERWGFRRQNTGGSVGGKPETRLNEESEGKEVTASSPEREALVTPLLEHGGYISEGGEIGGTIKAPPSGLTAETFSPKLSDAAVDSLAPMRLHIQRDGTPRGERTRTEVTPTPERPSPSSNGLGLSPEAEPSPKHIAPSPVPAPSHDKALSPTSPSGPSTRSRYASLKTKGRVPSLRQSTNVDGYDSSDEATAPSQSMRRTTLRPMPAHVGTIFNAEKSSREIELEEQLSLAMERVKALETRLELESSSQHVHSRPTTPGSSSISRPQTPMTPMAGAVGFLLGKMGMLPANDGLPTRVGELPGYLFLVGVGVGAVMVRVLLGRGR